HLKRRNGGISFDKKDSAEFTPATHDPTAWTLPPLTARLKPFDHGLPGIVMDMSMLPRLMLAATFVGCGGVAASAQERPATPAFTAAQSERGQATYRQSCQDCHGSSLDNGEFGGPPLKGGYFRTRWGSGTVAVLYGYVSLTMPPDRPGQL